MGAHLDDLADDGAIALTTETSRGIAGFLGVFAIFCAPAVLVGLVSYAEDVPWSIERIAAGIALDTMMVLIGLVYLLFASRGTWVIDPKGLTFHPCHGPSRILPWSSIDRLRWSKDQAVFRGGDVSIPVPWAFFPPDVRGPARHRVEKLLAADFDLSLRERPAPEPLARVKLARGVLLLGAALGWTAVWASGMFAILWAGRDPSDDADRQRTWAATIAWLLVMVVVPLALCSWTTREQRRIAREQRRTRVDSWEWRVRLAKPALGP